MAVSLPIGNQRWPKFRILTRDSWGGTVTSGGGWKAQVMEGINPRANGFILKHYSRALLPQLGNAEVVFRYGVYNGQLMAGSVESNANQRQGQQWNPATDTLDIPSLIDKEIRIQAAYPDENGNVASGDWVTVFWGDCEYQIDHGWGGATIPSGERTYYLIDAFGRTRRWFLDRHGFISGSTTIAPAAGHPGYNVSKQSPSQIAGNKDSTNSNWEANTGDGVAGGKFVMPGAGTTWTDADAINEALTNHRTPGSPHWVLGGASDLFNTSSPWPVEEGESVFSLITRICNRARGRGAVLPSWTESSPDGPLTATLLAFAQNVDNIVYQDPAASQVTINGATTRSTTKVVNVIGDHRFLPDSLRLGDPEQFRVDYLVSQGERIEVLGTVEHSLTLEPGWSSGEQTSFLALDPENRISERWKPVFQLHRLKRGFAMNLANGNGSGQTSADYRCKDDGNITADLQPNSIGNSAPSMIEVLDDLPLYEGYTYSSTPARADSQTVAQFAGTPPRRPPLLLIKTADDRYIRHSALAFSVQMHVKPDGILITCDDDNDTGQRKIGDTGESDLGSAYAYTAVVMTLGFRLPHRVRLATGNPNGERRLIITHPDIHLWLAAGTAIWDLNDASADNDGCPGMRTAGGTTPGILRDDRSALARLHALAVAWYRPQQPGVAQAVHRNASWALRCCGDIPTSTAYDGGGVIYPTCGYVVTNLLANGQTIQINSVVSSVVYNNENGTTTWTTDWQDLDLRHG